LTAYADKLLFELIFKYKKQMADPQLIEQKVNNIKKYYARAWRISGSYKNRDSVTGEIWFLDTILDAVVSGLKGNTAKVKRQREIIGGLKEVTQSIHIYLVNKLEKDKELEEEG
ncbi:MAG: hypothetical protein AAFV25_21035, partial [Bacteroidota bacterium]